MSTLDGSRIVCDACRWSSAYRTGGDVELEHARAAHPEAETVSFTGTVTIGRKAGSRVERFTGGQDQVLAVIKAAALPISVSEIAAETGMPASSVRARVKALRHRGVVRQAGSTCTGAATFAAGAQR